MKVISRRKQLIDKAKNEENVPSLEVIEVVLVQCNFVDNQYHPKFEILCTFMSNKSFVYLLLKAEPSNSVFLKTIILSLMISQ